MRTHVNRKSFKRTLIAVTLLLTVVPPMCIVTNPAVAAAHNSTSTTVNSSDSSVLSEIATLNPISITSGPTPTVEVIDYENGTTATIINYPDGSREEFYETITTETEYRVPTGTVDQSLTQLVPTSEEECTEMVTVTETAVLQQEVVMGFTYDLVSKRIDIVDAGIQLTKTKLWINIEIGFGLRLPVRVILEYPEQMTLGKDYIYNAIIEPLNWDAEDYKEVGIVDLLGQGNDNELIFAFEVTANLLVKTRLCILVWYPLPLPGEWKWECTPWVTLLEDSWGPDFNWSKDFTTPIGPGQYFPGLPTASQEIVDIYLLAIYLSLTPHYGSKKVTARASTGGDAAPLSETITWDAPGKQSFTVTAADQPNTDYASIQLSDFRYYFTEFKLELSLDIDFKNILDWISDREIVIWTFDLSVLTSELYLGVHAGTDGTMAVSVFVKKFGIQLIITPDSQDLIPGEVGTYGISVINLGNVPDIFDLSMLPLPPPIQWSYEFSTTEVSVDAYGSTDIELYVSPTRHWSNSPGDYEFEVTGTSRQAWVHCNSIVTGSDTAIVHVLPFYETDVSITPSSIPVEPGDMAVYSIEVTNLGNVPDTFDISLSFTDFDGTYRVFPTVIQEEWTVLNPTGITRDPGASGIAMLSIKAPNDWAGMEGATYEFTATATSATDPIASDTDTAELTVHATKESKTRYINLELQWLTDMVSSAMINEMIKESLLDKLTSATTKKEQALNYIIEDRIKLANNMLKACKSIMKAYIDHVEAQHGKYIPEATADDWIAMAQTIIADIETTIATQV